MDETAPALATRVLTLRFDTDAQRPDYPVVTILVDGRDLVAGTALHDFMGFDPADLLGTGAPLLPADPPRRVAVYRCSCGEAGCRCIAPVISREGNQVVWSDARDFTGVYVKPTIDPSPSGGTTLGLPDLRFHARQYEAEVRRATADRSWETERRATARLLADHLRGPDQPLRPLGYRLHWAEPDSADPEGFRLSLVDSGRRQVVVRFRAPAQPPNERAAALLTQLLSNPDDWNVVFRGEPTAWPDHLMP